MARLNLSETVIPVLGVVVIVAFALSLEESTSSSATGPDSTDGSRVQVSRDRSTVSTDPFGIRTDRYPVEEGRVDRAETFSDVLIKHGVEYQTILELAEAVRPEFDVQEFRTGRPYRVYRNPWLQEAQYLVYQIDAARYVVFDVRRPEQTRVEERTVRRRWATIGGTIDGSLYETLVEAGGHPLLALRLSEVFAWQIDFFRIRAGDRFRLVYEKRSVGETTLQPGDVIAASVEHLGEEYYAFRLDTGEGADYFNREGQSLRRQLLKAPLQYTRISSQFTNRRFHPVLKEYRPHRGTDYAAPRGTPVRSVGDGVVQVAGYRGANGNYVKIRHNGTYTTGYLHLSQIAVASGEEVEQGETIGYVGSTGRSTGPHLDYRLWKHGTPVDPYTIDLPPAQPVPIRYREAFRRTVDALLPRLRHPSVFAQLRSGSGTAVEPS